MERSNGLRIGVAERDKVQTPVDCASTSIRVELCRLGKISSASVIARLTYIIAPFLKVVFILSGAAAVRWRAVAGGFYLAGVKALPRGQVAT